jgi:hypothetical protein
MNKTLNTELENQKRAERFSDYLKSNSFILPPQPLLYDLSMPCSFSGQGERMIRDLLDVSKDFPTLLNNFLPLEEQVSMAQESFQRLKAEYMGTKEAEARRLEMAQGSRRRGYFFDNRPFLGGLTPKEYYRTNAPRLTTKGSTLHGMRKDVKSDILKQITNMFDCQIIDFDFAGAHAVIATRLLGPSERLLRECVSSSSFWDDQTEIFMRRNGFSDLKISQKECRAMLKIMLYTSLNGGNPLSPARVFDNLGNFKFDLVIQVHQGLDFRQSADYANFCKVFAENPLIEEVKSLNEKCVGEWGDRVYTVDNTSPYKIESKHKGISRVLQSFEVVMLSVLVRGCLSSGLLPLSLDHNGVLCLDINKTQVTNLEKDLTDQMCDWSTYLLKRPIQVVAKNIWRDGQLEKM